MTTIVFPGQGSQFANMTKDFYDNSLIVKKTFQEVEDFTKIKISNLIFENKDDLINQTKYTQIAIFTSSISIFNFFKSEVNYEKKNVNFMLGHSLGEYTALAAANILSIEDCSKLLKTRGELMQNAYPPNQSSMAAVLGFSSEFIDNFIKENNLNIEVANDNSPVQVVVSGKIEDLEIAEILLKKLGAKRFIFLNVSAAFHCNLMKGAEEKMKNYISKVNFSDSNIKLISNFTGKLADNRHSIIENLSNQMSNRVRWVESIKCLDSKMENEIIEIGPGKVLSGLIKRISNNFKITNLEKLSDIEKVL